MTKAQPPSGRPLLIRLDSGSGLTAECYALSERPETVVGRAETADIQIPSHFRDVSNRHAEIVHLSGDNYMLVHRGTNPTRVIRQEQPSSPSKYIDLRNRGDQQKLEFNDVIILSSRLRLKFVSSNVEGDTQKCVTPLTSLCVVLNADGVGYSKLMGENEIDVVSKNIEDCYRIFTEACEDHGAKFPERSGDGIQLIFSAATEAVSYAKKVQHKLMLRNLCLPVSRQMRFRVGCDLGEIECKEGAKPGEVTYGQAVCRAQRIQQLAEPGGLLISGLVYEALTASGRSEFRRIGSQLLLGRLVELYQLIDQPRLSNPI